MKAKYFVYAKILAKKPLLLVRIIENYIRMLIFKQKRLRKVEIGITFECMALCEKCSSFLMKNTKRKKLGAKQIRRIAEEVLELGAIQVNFTGGEPLMEKNLENIIKFFKPHKTVITINTNGFILTKERIKSLKQAGVDIFKISIDSPVPEEHDASRGLKGAFEKAVAAIDFINQEKNIFAHMSVILIPGLFKDGRIYRLIDLAREKRITLGITMPAPIGKWHGKKILFSSKELMETKRILKNRFVVTDMDAGYGGKFCPAGKEELYITCYGDVIPCPLIQISFGNMGENTLQHIWQKMYQHSFFNHNVRFCRASQDKAIQRYVKKHFHNTLPLYIDEGRKMRRRYFCCLPRREIILYPGIFSDIKRNLFLLKKHCRGEYVNIFEKKFARYIGVKYALSVGSGRAALITILKSLELGGKDEVILSAYNFSPLIGLIKSLGLKPVLVDIDRETLSIDIPSLKKNITEKTKVIIVTHFFGQAAELDALSRIAKEHGVFLIEDCAHSCGAEYQSKKVGSIGDAGSFSFSFAKNLNTFLGGMITTDNKDLFVKMKKRADTYKLIPRFTMAKEVFKVLIFKILFDRKVYPFTVWPFIWLGNLASLKFDIMRIRRHLRFKRGEISDRTLQFSDFQASIGIKQLEFLDTLNRKRAEKAEKLKLLLNPSIQTQSIVPNSNPVYSFFLLFAQNREKVVKKLISKGIDVDIGFMANCTPLVEKGRRYPSLEWVEQNSLLIRLRHSLSIKDIYCIADILNDIL